MTTVGAEIELGEVVGFEEELCLDVQDGKEHYCDEEGSGDDERDRIRVGPSLHISGHP